MLEYRWRSHGVPFVKKEGSWEIDIHVGTSPFELGPDVRCRNPVLTANDVTDVRAYFVADPFMVLERSSWYMFFEVLNRHTQRGEIALATSSDGFRWRYQQVVLTEPFHLSYPHVFRWRDDYYMIPETFQARSIRLYRAVDFPTKWAFAAVLWEGEELVDSSVCHVSDLWWLFTAPPTNDVLRLFYAKDLTGPWSAHPASPIVRGDASIARPGGRVLVFDRRVVRFAQDCLGEYGRQLRAFEITDLTTVSYREHKVSDNPIMQTSWKRPRRVHHVDAHQLGDGTWIACADSFREGLVFGLRY
jgi:hypothetical protein